MAGLLPGLPFSSMVPRVAASDALAAAIARGGNGSEPELEPKGKYLPPSPAVFDIDSIPATHVQQLRVMAITKLKSEYRERVVTQVAANATYICYGLKPGHIRALSKETASKALLKGHNVVVTDMQFGAASNVLASCDEAGEVHVRSLAESVEGQLQDELLVRKSFGPNDAATRRLAWHPTLENLLAVVAIDRISFLNIPPTLGVASFPEFSEPATPDGPQTEGEFTSVAFSSRGDVIAAADTRGEVLVWSLPTDFSTRPRYEALSTVATLRFHAHSGPAASLHFLPATPAGHDTLVTGGARGTSLKLWAVTRPDAAQPTTLHADCTYDLTITSAAGGEDVFNHVVMQPAFSVLLLANTRRQQVYVLHARQGPGPVAVLDYVAAFAVMQPVLSASACSETGATDGAGHEVFHLCTVQTEAVQEYTLYPAACFPSADLVRL